MISPEKKYDVHHQAPKESNMPTACHNTVCSIDELIEDARRRAREIEEAQGKFPDVPL